MSNDPYEILEVSPTGSNAEIKWRYRFLSHAYHPDKFTTDEQKQLAAEVFKRIDEAYKTLSDPAKRATLDEVRARSHAAPRSEPDPGRAQRSRSPHERMVCKENCINPASATCEECGGSVCELHTVRWRIFGSNDPWRFRCQVCDARVVNFVSTTCSRHGLKFEANSYCPVCISERIAAEDRMRREEDRRRRADPFEQAQMFCTGCKRLISRPAITLFSNWASYGRRECPRPRCGGSLAFQRT